jgi:hypothetical protein
MSRRVNRHRGGARTEARQAEKEQRFQEEKEQRFQEEKESLNNMDENSLYVKLKGEYEKAYKEIYNGDTIRAREKAMTELRKMGEQNSNKSMKDRYIEEILEFNSTINWFKRRLSGKDKKKKLPKKKSSKKKKPPEKKKSSKKKSSKKKKKQGGGKSKKTNKAKPRKAKKTNKRPRSIKFKRAGISKLSSRSPERNNPYPF